MWTSERKFLAMVGVLIALLVSTWPHADHQMMGIGDHAYVPITPVRTGTHIDCARLLVQSERMVGECEQQFIASLMAPNIKDELWRPTEELGHASLFRTYVFEPPRIAI